jgi:trans-aconitate 2-methyltransferase
MAPWEPDQYQRFQRERAQPFEDALALVKRRAGLRVVDLGCGTGELTRRLADALPDGQVVGVDSSPEMLARAQAHAGGRLSFERRRIEDVDGEWDLIFSHAALHWVADHRRLVPRLVGQLRPGGQLVVQMPSNASHPSQTHLRAAAREEPFAAALGGWTYDWPVLTINDYGELLHGAGAVELTVYEKLYVHLLDGADALAEWMRGTAMVPYLERLPEALREPLVARYRERLRGEWSARPLFFGFRRTLFAATRA